MPFTPFHMGPGLLFKSILGASFSIIVFGWTQIVMDLQPLLALFTGWVELHGFTHTFLGATIIALLSTLSGRWLIHFFYQTALRDRHLNTWFSLNHLNVKPSVIYFSAFIGSFSHVILDALMHDDVMPFFPLKVMAIWTQWLSNETIYRYCIYSGIAGLFLILVRWRLQKLIKHDN